MPRLLFSALLLLGVILAIASIGNLPVLGIFEDRVYLQALRILFLIGFCLLLVKWFLSRFFRVQLLKWIYGLAFLPLLVLPIYRCYFHVPYVFCRACPQPCPWGLIRTFVFNLMLTLNCFDKFWCTTLCPFGAFQECQTRISKKTFKVSPKIMWMMAYLVLLVVTGMYFLTLFESSWLRFFERGQYGWTGAAVGIFVLILTIAWVIPKFWCRFFCPIGTLAELTASFQKTSAGEK